MAPPCAFCGDRCKRDKWLMRLDGQQMYYFCTDRCYMRWVNAEPGDRYLIRVKSDVGRD